MERFTGDLNNREDLIREFQLDEKALEQSWIIFAHYGTGGYDGSAFVIFQENGKLYEVNGSHCSCHGLEGQWEPEETSVEALFYRIEQGTLGEDSYSGLASFKDDLIQALNNLEVTLEVGGQKIKV